LQNNGVNRRSFAAFEDGLISSDLNAGQSSYEATGGIHPSRICKSSPQFLSVYRDQYFCDFQEEPIPWTYLPPSFFMEEAIASNLDYGIFQPCPDTNEACHLLNITGASLQGCLTYCGNLVEVGGACSETARCGFDNTFCNRKPGDATGICSECPFDVEECGATEFDLFSKKSCLECNLKCSYNYWADFTVEDQVIWAAALSTTSSWDLALKEVIAPLVDCSDLVLQEVVTCVDAKGSICLINNYLDANLYGIGVKSTKNGCLAMVIYYPPNNVVPDDHPYPSSLAIDDLPIPAIIISHNSGSALQVGSIANVTVFNEDSDNFYAPLAAGEPTLSSK
jgi:hypothetical protein